MILNMFSHGIFMFNAFLRSFYWFLGQSEETQVITTPEHGHKKRPRPTVDRAEKTHSKRQKTENPESIDLTNNDLGKDKETPEFICDKRKGLRFSCSSSTSTHAHNLAKLKEKYSNDREIQSIAPRIEACLRFKEKGIAPEELWLSSIIIRKFAQKLEHIHSDFKFIDYSLTVIPFLYDLQSETQASEEEQDEGFVQIPFKQILRKAVEQLKDKKHVAISINDGSHYYSLLVDLTDVECIKIYGSDSLDMLQHHAEYLQNASTYFSALYPEAIIAYEAFKIPNQQNIYDCGVSLCALMEKHARGEFKSNTLQAFSKQEFFNYGPYRQRIADILLIDEADFSNIKENHLNYQKNEKIGILSSTSLRRSNS